MFSFQEDVLLPVRIKVIGVGGAGVQRGQYDDRIRLGPRRFYFGKHRSSGTGSFAGSRIRSSLDRNAPVDWVPAPGRK